MDTEIINIQTKLNRSLLSKHGRRLESSASRGFYASSKQKLNGCNFVFPIKDINLHQPIYLKFEFNFYRTSPHPQDDGKRAYQPTRNP